MIFLLLKAILCIFFLLFKRKNKKKVTTLFDLNEIYYSIFIGITQMEM